MLYYALIYELELVRQKYVPMMPVSSGINENQNQTKHADNMYRSCVILHKPGHIYELICDRSTRYPAICSLASVFDI